MESRSCLINTTDVVVVDTSTVINLNATGCASEILKALPNHLQVATAVVSELELGRQRRRQDADLLVELVSVGLIEVVELNDQGTECFEELVVGSAAVTLDDGEAATIACAIANGAIAVIDERKANRICSERFPHLRVGSTVDIFMHPEVQRILGRQKLSDAVLSSLRYARMRVLGHHLDWVVGLIGPEQAITCSSLPRDIHTFGSERTG